jgi:hypothetical protein
MYGCLGKYIQSFGEDTEMKEDHLERLDVSGRTKVKQIITNNWRKRGLDGFGPGCVKVASSFV